MQRVTPGQPWPLHDVPAIRRLEQRAAAALPPHTLMQRAGLAVARLSLALAPHARTIWVACGPGNNGGDGFEAAMHLKQWGKQPVVTWLGDEQRAPDDARFLLINGRSEAFRNGTQPRGGKPLAGPQPYNRVWPNGRISGAPNAASAAQPPPPPPTPPAKPAQDLSGLY